MGATRTRVGRVVRRPGVLGYLGALVVLGGGAALGTRAGAGVGLLAAVALGGLVLAFVALLLPRLSGSAMALVGIGGLILLANAGDGRGVFVWPGAVGLGATLATEVLWRRQEARRPPGADTARLRTFHDEAGELVERADPPAAETGRLVERLDGRSRTGVSVLRPPARLDVGGDARGPLLVALCEDTTVKRPVWSVVASEAAHPPDAEVSVRVAGIDAFLPTRSTTTLGPALAALEAFLLTGRPAEGVPWRADTEAEDLRAVFDNLG
ncbi:hypothetical protein SAMN04488544_0152 [Microlunatus sagamiharensis]|uniref:Uncharacterized protein n=1 Tax=Microlunatus sagamiharensis TaxID=546874 RepID=A0A1H2LI90_9ACTN|nr:hypothetical protein [Microlunatus sagamiharensis]SDU80281.1 hypothetical protein SAMN04488544_0152 [Microlunatus sagamiharensis]